MIKLLREGTYELIETKAQTKILTLDGDDMFAWIYATNIGEMLVMSHHPHKTDHVLAVGRYRLYDVKKEDSLTDLRHLELLVGHGTWQGYLLPNGLPTNSERRHRILPSEELITKSTH